MPRRDPGSAIAAPVTAEKVIPKALRQWTIHCKHCDGLLKQGIDTAAMTGGRPDSSVVASERFGGLNRSHAVRRSAPEH